MGKVPGAQEEGLLLVGVVRGGLNGHVVGIFALHALTNVLDRLAEGRAQLGRFFGPKITRTTSRMTASSIGPMPKTM